MKYSSKTDLVTAALRELIISGELTPGETMNQREYAARFGVSLTPIREALQRLQSEGLIDYHLHRTATVAKAVGASPALDNYQIRALLEPFAAGLAAIRITEGELLELRATHEALSFRARRDEVAQDLNQRFHFQIYEAARSPLLLALLRLLWRNVPARLQRGVAVSNKQHGEILAALERGSAEDAERCAREHILSSMSSVSEKRKPLGPGGRRRTGQQRHDGSPGGRTRRSRQVRGVDEG